MIRLAIYDMDRTITHAPTWTPFLLHSARRHAPWRLLMLPAAVFAGLAYVARLIDRARLKQTTQRLMLGGALAPAVADRAVTAFADRLAATGVFAGARAQIEADRAAGYQLVMATASYHFYAAAIAERLGFDAVIGTQAQVDEQGRIRARIVGENCYGPAKLRMIRAWMVEQGISREDAHIRFYSDHVSDAPVLEWADEPFAVNAHDRLRALARARGWPILDWER